MTNYNSILLDINLDNDSDDNDINQSTDQNIKDVDDDSTARNSGGNRKY